MKNWYKFVTAAAYGPQKCPYCKGTGGVSGGPYAPRKAKCYDCDGTGYLIQFEPGEEVSIDSPDAGELTGIVDEAYEFYDGEWYYKVSVDDLMDTVTVRESNMTAI